MARILEGGLHNSPGKSQTSLGLSLEIVLRLSTPYKI